MSKNIDNNVPLYMYYRRIFNGYLLNILRNQNQRFDHEMMNVCH